MKYTATYRREIELFEKTTFKTNKIQAEILADTLNDAVEIALKKKFKHYYLLGVKSSS